MSSVIRGDDDFDSVAASHGRVLRTAGNVTTTSTSLVSFTGASITLTTGANPVAYGTTQTTYNNSAGALIIYNIDIDGALQHGAGGQVQKATSVAEQTNISFSGMSAALSAGSHTIKVRWFVNAGTGTILATADNSHLFYAYEVK